MWSPNKPVVQVVEEKENDLTTSYPVVMERRDGINDYDMAPFNYLVRT